jgi:hypothetical protein
MTLRDMLEGLDQTVHARLDDILDSEDGIIVLADRRATTTYLRGFGASGCQLEILARELEGAVRQLRGTPDDEPCTLALP